MKLDIIVHATGFQWGLFDEYDIQASVKKFTELLAGRLKRELPGVEVSTKVTEGRPGEDAVDYYLEGDDGFYVHEDDEVYERAHEVEADIPLDDWLIPVG